MARPDAKEIWQRGQLLAPLRKRAFEELELNPALTGIKLAQMLKVNQNTAIAWKQRWKKQKEKGKAQASVKPAEITPEAVAAALLNQVVAALSEHEKLRVLLKGYKSQVLSSEKAVEIEKQEKGRILKIHNNQVKARSLTDSKTLMKLAKI